MQLTLIRQPSRVVSWEKIYFLVSGAYPAGVASDHCQDVRLSSDSILHLPLLNVVYITGSSSKASRPLLSCTQYEDNCLLNSRSTLIFLHLQWSFSLGLAISSLLDVLITVSLCYLLQKKHKKNSRLAPFLSGILLIPVTERNFVRSLAWIIFSTRSCYIRLRMDPSLGTFMFLSSIDQGIYGFCDSALLQLHRSSA